MSKMELDKRLEENKYTMWEALKILADVYLANRGTRYEFVICITNTGIPYEWERVKQVLAKIDNPSIL